MPLRTPRSHGAQYPYSALTGPRLNGGLKGTLVVPLKEPSHNPQAYSSKRACAPIQGSARLDVKVQWFRALRFMVRV